jgi:pilus assembly protein CpaF
MTSSHPTAAAVAQRIRERFAHETGELDAITAEEVSESLGDTICTEEGFSPELHNELNGLGLLQPFLDDPSIEELWINGPDSVFVATAGVNRKVDVALSDLETRRLIERMLRHTGRRVDMSQPFVDASLPDGSRLHVVIPDITKKHWSINIRKFSVGLRDFADLVQAGPLIGWPPFQTRERLSLWRRRLSCNCVAAIIRNCRSGSQPRDEQSRVRVIDIFATHPRVIRPVFGD